MEGLKVKGKVIAILWDPKTGEVVERVETDNVVTTAGKQTIVSYIVNGLDRDTVKSAVAVGTGNGTPSENDTSLFNMVLKRFATIKIDPEDSSGKTVRYEIEIAENELAGETLTEVGVFENVPADDITKGTLLNHAMFPNPINKTNQYRLTIYVKITLV